MLLYDGEQLHLALGLSSRGEVVGAIAVLGGDRLVIVADLERPTLFFLGVPRLDFHRTTHHLLVRDVVKSGRLEALVHVSLPGHHGAALDQMLIVLEELEVSGFGRRVQTDVRVAELIEHSASLLGVEGSALMRLVH